MGQLRPDYFASAKIVTTTISVPITHNNYEAVWIVEQIAVKYSVAADYPRVTVIKNGSVFSGAAQFLQGSAGLAQTFAGQPYLFVEADDAVSVFVENGTANALVSVQAQYRVIRYDDDELAGRI